MTEQLPTIERELMQREAELYEASIEYRKLAREAAEKRATYDTEYAKAMLMIVNMADAQEGKKLTVQEKDALAVKAVAGYLTDCRIAEGIADGTKEHLRALQAILSSIQTRSRLLQTEASLTARQT